MNLQIENQLFIVGGATSGFGKAIAKQLVEEGARVIAIARSEDQLRELQTTAPKQIEWIAGDITNELVHEKITSLLGERILHGIVVNAGGPPAKTVMETTAADWDNAYHSLLRWKVLLIQRLLPVLVNNKYGRCVFIESATVKQPLENLVLSNSLRAAVVGMVKTLSHEIAASGVTLNIMAPGSHNTPAINRIYNKKSEQTGIAFEEIKAAAIQQIPVKFLGEASDFASLAVWLLSPHSRFITGQTISVDGGAVRGIMG
ncbi:MAG: SDR family oxidoreductase [Chitinophagia bacterium]|nr:SDR family oxidoreductase [Chitinophagia bacterium]